MKSKFLGFIMAFVAMFAMSSCGYERIDAGHEGILVNLYGDDKGVGDVSMCTGAVWYNPFTQSVYEYPTFVQTVDYEPFDVEAKGGLKFMVDPTVSIKMIDGQAPTVFKKHRKSLDKLINTTILNYVKNAFRIQLNQFEADYIINHRDSIENAIESYLNRDLVKEGFQLEQFTSGLQCPEEISKSVIDKTNTIQLAQTAENEVRIAEANAKKLLVEAQAEAEANKLKQQSLTPQIIEKMWIEKWDGSVPTVMSGSNTSTFLDLSKVRK